MSSSAGAAGPHAKADDPGAEAAANRARSVHAGYRDGVESCAAHVNQRDPWNNCGFRRFAPGKRSLNMTSLKVLSAAAALALVLPMATPSFAQSRASVVGGGAHIGGGGGGAHFGGGGFSGGARMGGAGFSGGGA